MKTAHMTIRDIPVAILEAAAAAPVGELGEILRNQGAFAATVAIHAPR